MIDVYNFLVSDTGILGKGKSEFYTCQHFVNQRHGMFILGVYDGTTISEDFRRFARIILTVLKKMIVLCMDLQKAEIAGKIL